MVGLPGVEARLPEQLSGGQRQRVALARALVIEPTVLLLDEPLSNLDAVLRKRMRLELRELQQRLGITTIFVTHDQDEAFEMSDRVVLLNGGRVEQVGTPEELYDDPATRFAAEFIGEANLIEGVVGGHDRRHGRGGHRGGAVATTLAPGRSLQGGDPRLRDDPARADRSRLRAPPGGRRHVGYAWSSAVFSGDDRHLRAPHGSRAPAPLQQAEPRRAIGRWRRAPPCGRSCATAARCRATAPPGPDVEASGRYGRLLLAPIAAIYLVALVAPISFFLVMSVFRYSALDALDPDRDGRELRPAPRRVLPPRDHRCGRSRSPC